MSSFYEVVSVQVVFRHQSCYLHSSAVGQEEDGEDRVWAIGDKRGMNISGPSNSLLQCCFNAPSSGNPGKRALFCIPQGPMYSVSRDGDGIWLQGLHGDRPNYPQKLSGSSVLMTLSCPPAAPHPFSSYSVLPFSLLACCPLILGSSGPAPETAAFLPNLLHTPCW